MKRRVVLLSLLAGACADGARRSDTASSGPSAPADTAYRLAAGDKIRITVVGEDQGSGVFEVDSTGSISTALSGRLTVQGLTVAEVEQALGQIYRDRKILIDPRISVEAVNLRPFFILGEVEKRGSYPYMPGLTVAQAAALAGGYTYRASRSGITVQRQGGAEEPATENTLVRPGDIIRVPERWF